MGSPTARKRLLDAAAQLFYTEGMVGTGIDTITSTAGVAKMSLYNNFSSKEDLMLAYIHARHREWKRLYEDRVAHAQTPSECVLAVFDAYIDHANASPNSSFRGCGLLNAAAELPAGSEGRAAVREHKQEVRDIISGHLTELLSPEQARATADHLALLLEGAVSLAGLDGTTDKLAEAKGIAHTIMVER